MKKRVKRKGRPSVIEKNTADFNKEFRSESVSRVGVERERENKKKKKTLDRPQETNECRKRERERERERREKELKGRKKKKKRKKEKKEKLENFHPSFHHARLFGKRTTIATTTRRLNALGQLSRRQVHGYEGLID